MADWPEGIDMDALLAPIAGDSPVGVDLREDFTAQSPYFRLRDARTGARDGERAEDAGRAPDPNVPLPAAYWRTVRELSMQLLSTRTKDLEIAAWLTESLVRSDGLRGLSAGAHLLSGLVDAYWDAGMFPLADEDGVATRVAPLTGLNGEGGGGTLIQPLRKLPMFNRPDGAMLAYWQYEQSEELKKEVNAAKIKQRLAAGWLKFEDVENDARAAGQARFAALRAAGRAATREWLAMNAVLDAKVGRDGPPTSHVRDLVANITNSAARYAPADVDEPEAEEAAAEETVAEGEAGTPGTARPRAAVVSREDMLKELSRIAEYFKKTEPQSPLAYTLDEAIRRGRLSWPELLAEVMSDDKARDAVLIQLGIRPTPAA